MMKNIFKFLKNIFRKPFKYDINSNGHIIKFNAPKYIEYYNNRGQPHRVNGPAIESNDGYQEWCINGIIHRDHGPAIIHGDGSKYWYKQGKLHRTDGPAMEWYDGQAKWFVNGTDITKSVKEWMKENNISYPFSEENLILFQLTFLY